MEVFRKEFICQKFEAHNHTEETLFAMTGGILIPFAKPGKFTEDEIHIFYIPKGAGISCRLGVWHWAPYTLEESVMCMVIFKKNTSREDIYFTELAEPVGFEL